MIIFKNELPLDHERSLQTIAAKWAKEFYLDSYATIVNEDHAIESAWSSIEEHLSSEGLTMEHRLWT